MRGKVRQEKELRSSSTQVVHLHFRSCIVADCAADETNDVEEENGKKMAMVTGCSQVRSAKYRIKLIVECVRAGRCIAFQTKVDIFSFRFAFSFAQVCVCECLLHAADDILYAIWRRQCAQTEYAYEHKIMLKMPHIFCFCLDFDRTFLQRFD